MKDTEAKNVLMTMMQAKVLSLTTRRYAKTRRSTACLRMRSAVEYRVEWANEHWLDFEEAWRMQGGSMATTTSGVPLGHVQQL